MHTYIVKDDATCMIVTIRLSREVPFSLEPKKVSQQGGIKDVDSDVTVLCALIWVPMVLHVILRLLAAFSRKRA